LLVQIRDPQNQTAWHEFVEVYAPLIHSYARKRGLQDADAADLTQDVMQTISRRAEDFQYNPARGSFRGWLFTVTLNRLRDFVDRRSRQAKASGKTEVQNMLQELPEREAEELWIQQHQMRLFHWAAEKAKVDFRETTWQAFWLTAVENRSVKEVATELNVSVGAIHIAKSRALARIRDILQQVEDQPHAR
jgi:RNA polymerase sigma-70 factor (ECF subfamily)